MIISAKAIRKVKARHYCEQCEEAIHDSALRLYGAATPYEEPYVIYLHPECCTDQDQKVLQAKNLLKNLF